MMKRGIIFALACLAGAVQAREYHVAKSGSDRNDGSAQKPFLTIQHAADLARPGGTVVVHEGTYRERVNPKRGGTADGNRIVYQAAPGEQVAIKGSEKVSGWQQVEGDAWKVVLPNSFFGGFNPYREVVGGAWFRKKDQECHLGAVYLDGHWLTEAATLEMVLEPAGEEPLWFAEVDDRNTTIWAQFPGADPNEADVEVNVRQSVFYPEEQGINFITVRGFTLEQAATPWAPPTAEQIGVVGTHWSKGWIIENNTIRYSTCVGLTLGKYGDGFDNTYDYNRTIKKALADGWSKENIGHHMVRNNRISHCEQAGIVGSLGAAFCTIDGNEVHDIHVRRLYSGCEMAGIKFHAPIDTVISNNRIYNTPRGLWLDWMTQGTRVTGNLFHNNAAGNIKWSGNWGANAPDGEQDMFLEVNHGPFLVDNNIFLSPYTLNNRSQGVVFAHNLFAGAFKIVPYDERQTPYHKAHSTEVVTTHDNPGGDNHYFNNLFITHADLRGYDHCELPSIMKGNVFVNGAVPSGTEKAPLVQAGVNPEPELVEKPDGLYLNISFDGAWASALTPIVTSEKLPDAVISGLPYESRDGKPYRITGDYFGGERRKRHPYPGPFALQEPGRRLIKVWPKK